MLDSLDTLIAFTLIFTVTSLLITIVVNIILSVWNLRACNLAWGVAEAFEAIAPDLKAQTDGAAKKLADHLLSDYLISDFQLFNWHPRASAVRADELFDLLHRIATGRKDAITDKKEDLRNDVISIFRALGVDDGDLKLACAEVKSTEDVLKTLSDSVTALKDVNEKNAITTALANVTTRMGALTTNAAKQAATTGADAEARIRRAYQQFEQWFEMGQERSQQWFTTHAKIVTGILGLIFAFVLQLDTFEIYKQVSTNRAMRDKLVAESSGVLGQAGKILGEKNDVLSTAFDNWKTDKDTTEAIRIAVKYVKVSPDDTRGTIRQHVETALTDAKVDGKEAALNNFDKAVDKTAEDKLKSTAADYRLVKSDLEKTGFNLFPGWPWEDNRWRDGYFNHFVGMFFSALLLSLGAPFWFNTLKSLASLRSSVAGNIEDEKKKDLKDGKANKSGEPPPTVLPPK